MITSALFLISLVFGASDPDVLIIVNSCPDANAETLEIFMDEQLIFTRKMRDVKATREKLPLDHISQEKHMLKVKVGEASKELEVDLAVWDCILIDIWDRASGRHTVDVRFEILGTAGDCPPGE